MCMVPCGDLAAFSLRASWIQHYRNLLVFRLPNAWGGGGYGKGWGFEGRAQQAGKTAHGRWAGGRADGWAFGSAGGGIGTLRGPPRFLFDPGVIRFSG